MHTYNLFSYYSPTIIQYLVNLQTPASCMYLALSSSLYYLSPNFPITIIQYEINLKINYFHRSHTLCTLQCWALSVKYLLHCRRQQHTAVSNRHFYHHSSSQHCGRHNKPPTNQQARACVHPKGALGCTHSLTHSLMWRIHFFVHYITAGRCKPTVCSGHIQWFPAWCIRNGAECLEQKLIKGLGAVKHIHPSYLY